MYSVILNSEDKGHSFSSFYETFINICKEHKTKGKAMAFAFILYDFENPQIKKVLEDRDYWLSLNSISGKFITVFSIHYKENIKIDINTDSRLHSLVTVTNDKNPSVDSNKLIQKYFGKSIIPKYPSILFFQIANENIADSILIELDSEAIEDSFLELKKYLVKTVEVLKKISHENRNNHVEVFSLIESEVKGIRSRKMMLRRVKKIISAIELASSIIGLSR